MQIIPITMQIKQVLIGEITRTQIITTTIRPIIMPRFRGAILREIIIMQTTTIQTIQIIIHFLGGTQEITTIRIIIISRMEEAGTLEIIIMPTITRREITRIIIIRITRRLIGRLEEIIITIQITQEIIIITIQTITPFPGDQIITTTTIQTKIIIHFPGDQIIITPEITIITIIKIIITPQELRGISILTQKIIIITIQTQEIIIMAITITPHRADGISDHRQIITITITIRMGITHKMHRIISERDRTTFRMAPYSRNIIKIRTKSI